MRVQPFRILRVVPLSLIILGPLPILLTSCEPTPISELSADDGIQRIRESHSEEKWDQVIQDVNEYRARYPYSQFATEAQLLQADANYQSARYPEAIVIYEEFLAKNVKHEKRALASFRIAEGYDLQSSDSVDREQDFSRKALVAYNTFVDNFTGDKEMGKARERMAALRRRIAEHELFVARFYWKKELPHASLARYLELIGKYPMYADISAEARERAAASYEDLASTLEDDPKSDAVVYYLNTTPAELRKKAAEVRRAK
jgi:outer membrane protein assembly factor BamD